MFATFTVNFFSTVANFPMLNKKENKHELYQEEPREGRSLTAALYLCSANRAAQQRRRHADHREYGNAASHVMGVLASDHRAREVPPRES